jgi:hypothetical protein
MQLFLSPDGMCGAAVTADLDLVSVFRHPDSTESMGFILNEVSQRAKTLDCFDVDGFLPALYRDYGWVEASRVKFDPAQQPAGWDTDTMGRPDVVLMAHGVSSEAARNWDPITYADWDDAADDRAILLTS